MTVPSTCVLSVASNSTAAISTTGTATSTVPSTSTTPSTPAPIPRSTASEKKPSKSPYLSFIIHDSDSEQIEFEDDFESLSGKGVRMLEMEGLQAVLQEGCKCKKCGCGPMEFREELYRREGFMTHPFLFYVSCSSKTPIQYKNVCSTKTFEINQNSIIANKCASGTYSSLNIFCTMQGLSPPVSASNYCNHAKAVDKAAITQAQASMKRAIL